ncbi:MAG: ABC transporter substrate-binding protein [Nocardioidaceae bacterium]
MRRRLCYGVGSLLLMLTSYACSSSTAQDRSGSSAVLRIGDTGSTISTLNPFLSSNVFETATFRYVYPFLVQYGTDGTVEGDFASSYRATAGGRVWTFHTHPGARWSDGTPLTAEDAVWTLNAILANKDDATARYGSYLAHVVSVAAQGPNQLTITYDTPVATALANLSVIPILPRQVWGKVLSGDASQLKNFTNDAPLVSGGAFVLTSEKKDAYALFKRNPNFYGPKPKIGGFGYQFFGSADAMVSAIKQGQIDVAYDVPATAAKTLRADSALQLLNTKGTDEDTLVFNSSHGQTKHPELLDPRVREAFHLAIDRKSMVDIVTLGMGQPTTSIIPPSLTNWADPKIGDEGFNPRKANQILDRLGYTRGAGGIRVANGHPMDYTLLQPSGLTGHDRVVELLRGDLAKIGVRIEVKVIDSDAFGQALVTPNADAPSYDLAVDDWISRRDPDFMLSLNTCAQRGNYNEAAYCNKGYDAAYNAQSTILDATKRKAAVDRAQKILDRDKPWVPLFANPNLIAVRNNVKGFHGSPFVVDTTSRHQIDDSWLS